MRPRYPATLGEDQNMIPIKPERLLEPCLERGRAGGRGLTLWFEHAFIGVNTLPNTISFS